MTTFTTSPPDLRRRLIVDTAVAIADKEGIEAVSMRRLANDLGAAAMSMYTYVSDKDELLDLMHDEICREMLIPEPLPDGWRPALRAIAIQTRDAIQSHPWIFDSPVRRPVRRINLMRHIEQSMQVATMIEADGPGGRDALTAVDDYVFGHCFRNRSREELLKTARTESPSRISARELAIAEVNNEVSEAIAAGELPLVEQRFGPGTRDIASPESDFETGLDWLLDGIEAIAGGRGGSGV